MVMTHIVTDIQRFCMHDGPGVRSTVFLKGCPLRCFWCHNAETNLERAQVFFYANKCIACGGCTPCPNGAHTLKGDTHVLDHEKCAACGKCANACPTNALTAVGKPMTSEEILAIALRDKAFYGKDGGITVSGGEPMLHPDRCIELLSLAKAVGLHTAVETSGYFPREKVEALCSVADLLLWDIKDTDDERHKKNTGVSNGKILENLRLADECGGKIVLRCILLKGINFNDEHLNAVRALFKSLKNGVKIEFLNCHSLGNSKREALGLPVRDLKQYELTKEEMAYAQTFADL